MLTAQCVDSDLVGYLDPYMFGSPVTGTAFVYNKRYIRNRIRVQQLQTLSQLLNFLYSYKLFRFISNSLQIISSFKSRLFTSTRNIYEHEKFSKKMYVIFLCHYKAWIRNPDLHIANGAGSGI